MSATPTPDPFSQLASSVPTANTSRSVTFTAAEIANVTSTLEDLLTALDIGGAISEPSVPSVVKAIRAIKQHVSLTYLTLGLAADFTSVDFVSFGVSIITSDIKFTIPNMSELALASVSLQIVAYNPSVGAAYPWNATLVAETSLFGMGVDISISLPHFVATIRSQPAQSTTAQSTSALSAFQSLGCTSGGLTSLLKPPNSGSPFKIAYFEACIDLSQKMFTFDLSITGDLSWHKFSLDGVSVSLTYAGGNVSFSVGARAQIGGATVQVSFADDGNGGLTLGGAAQFGTPLDVNAFLKSLDPGAPACPFDLQIDSLSIQVSEDGGHVSAISAYCGAVLVLEESGTSIALSLDMEKSGSDCSLTLGLGGLTLTGNTSSGVSVYSATLSPTSTLSFASIVHLLRIGPLADTPIWSDITVSGLFLAVNSTTSPKAHLFGLQFGLNATLPDNAIVDFVTGGGNVGLTSATLLAASAPWSAADLAGISGQVAGFQFPPQVPKGPSFAGTVTVGSTTVFAPLCPSGQQPPVPAAPGGGTARAVPSTTPPVPTAVTSSSAVRWFDVQKKVGPVYLARAAFALGHADGSPKVDLQCDASFMLGPITISLNDFAFAFPLKWGFTVSDIDVSLQGMSLAYNKPPLAISGGFLHTTDTAGDDIYAGEASIQTSALFLSAIGEYAKDSNGNTSLALFAALNDPPLGGPVFCFVTGLAAGFGYNSKLKIPATAAGVSAFALIAAADPSSPPPSNPMTVITQCVTPSAGDDWIAVGILFKSFQLLQSTALLTVAFGHDLQFALLGQSELSIPPQSPERLAYAQLDIEATYSASAGALEVFGVLSPNSFVFSPDCHLTGGFAYILKESGEFLATFGGYHPDFDYVSRGYPAVPRLQLLWRIDDHTSIKGSEYFALSSAVMMAGGALEATWTSGIFSAWFNLSVDLFMQWKPFHYSGDFSMSIGVSFDLHVWFVHIHFTFHVGASLNAAGPPFHGTAHIDLDVISFDVTFGHSPDSSSLLTWAEFRTLLPGDATADGSQSAVLSAKVTDGLIKDLSQAKSVPDWVVNGTHFCFDLRSSIPVADTGIGILPMGIGSATSTLEVTLTGPNGVVTTGGDPTSLVVVKLLSADMPAAHWGTGSPGLNDAPLSHTCGYRICGGRPDPDRTAAVLVSTLLAESHPVTSISDRLAYAQPFG